MLVILLFNTWYQDNTYHYNIFTATFLSVFNVIIPYFTKKQLTISIKSLTNVTSSLRTNTQTGTYTEIREPFFSRFQSAYQGVQQSNTDKSSVISVSALRCRRISSHAIRPHFIPHLHKVTRGQLRALIGSLRMLTRDLCACLAK